jgi:hypothetical protein
MKFCRRHPHTSLRSAIECYERTMSSKTDKKVKLFISWPPRQRVKMVNHSPPKTIVRNGVQYFIFSEDENVPYLGE